jgi:hypothetical protein
MSTQELIDTLRKAALTQNIALAMLLNMAADKLEELA